MQLGITLLICLYIRVFTKGDVDNFIRISEKWGEERGREMPLLVENALQLIIGK